MAELQRGELLALRLASQRLPLEGAHAGFRQAAPAVKWFGAVQAQEYGHARWALGLRSATGAAATDDAVQTAIARRHVVRTWALRSTLHLVAAADVRWMVALAAPALLTRTAAAYRKEGLDAPAFRKILPAIQASLQGGQAMTRAGLLDALAARGIATGGHRDGLMLYRAAQTGLICLGVPAGKQSTYTLLDEWLTKEPARMLSREQAGCELALRYFSSHGPASFDDFLWWSGLATGEARDALEMASARLSHALYEGVPVWWARHTRPAVLAAGNSTVHLLPGFDEYLLGYTRRDAVIDVGHAHHALTSNGLFRPTVVVNGRAVALWQAHAGSKNVAIEVTPFEALPRKVLVPLKASAARYARFAGLPVGTLSVR